MNVQTQTSSSELMTVRQVAQRLKVSEGWVKEHTKRRQPKLKAVRLGGSPHRAGVLRFRTQDIEQFILENLR